MTALNVHEFLKSHIRTVPDWPSPGVQFRDITPLLQNPRVFRVLIDAFVHRYMDPALRPDVVAGKKLLEKLGATVMEGAAIVDLPELGGSSRIRASGLKLFTLVEFEGH